MRKIFTMELIISSKEKYNMKVKYFFPKIPIFNQIQTFVQIVEMNKMEKVVFITQINMVYKLYIY